MPRSLDILVVDDSRTILNIIERTLRAEGHRVRAALDAGTGLAMAESARPNLVLVDTHLGDTSCEDFLWSLSSIDNLAEVPVITLEARPGERRSLANVADSLRKPFSPEALIAVVSGAQRRQRKAAQAQAQHVTQPAETSQDSASVSVAGSSVEESLDGLKLRSEDALAGRLEHISLTDILQLLHAQQQTGTLTVQSRELSVAITMLRGAIDLAQVPAGATDANRIPLRLGRYIIEESLVDPEDVEKAASQLRSRGREGTRLGEVLVRRGLLREEELARCLARQTSDLVFETMRMTRGVFRFQRGWMSEEAREARLGLGVSGLLLDGLRRVDEWRVLEARVHSFDMVLAVDTLGLRSLGRETLTHEERDLVDALDGIRTLREVAEHLTGEESEAHAEPRLQAFDVARIAHQLLAARVIRAVSTGA